MGDEVVNQETQVQQEIEGLPSYFNSIFEPKEEIKPAEESSPPAVGDVVELTPEQRQEKFTSINTKEENLRTDDEVAFFNEYQEELDQKKYEELIQKPEDQRTEEDNAFINDHKPLTAIEIAKITAMQDFGIDIIDAEIPDTPDGLKDVLGHVHDHGGKTAIEQLKEQFPSVAHQLEYLQLGGDPDTYRAIMYPDIDFSKIEILPDGYDAEKNPNQERDRYDVIAYDLKGQGYSDQDILEILEKYKEGNLIGMMAQKSQAKLVKEQGEAKKNILENRRQEVEDAKAEYNNYIKDLNNRFAKADKFGGIPVPPEAKKTFMQFMTMTRSDSMYKELPYSSELTYHTFNPKSPLYNEPKIKDMRESTYYWMFMYEQNPAFMEKLIENTAKTLRASKELPKMAGANSRLRTIASSGKESQTDILRRGKLIFNH